MICKNCIHYEVCCNECIDDEALTFCEDFFEVVRCKDCKYKHNYFTACCKLDGLEAINLDSFCSKGERKETE